MSEDEFWRIIEAAKADCDRQGGDVDRHTALLTERLGSLPETLRYAPSYACAAKTGLCDTSDGWPMNPDAIDAFVEARRAEEGPDADRGDWVPEAEIPRRLPRLAERCEALWALEPNRPGKWES